MGEIKSTLDLVMEKTRNLNLSDEEKQDQKNKEIESRLNGLLQKFEDQIITLEQFKAEYEALCKAYNLTGRQHQHLLKAICARIELGKDNQVLLGMLSQFTDSNVEGLKLVLQDYAAAIQTAAEAQGQIVKDALASEHHISGSAVVPNLESDPVWRTKIAEIRADFEVKLKREKTNI
ncbi:MAG: hypothetical protein JRE72_15235 [Deltaproteobacteria bacterium]|jgi:hypothetical protein|nr:hypothetical protein [Deltaproteobacteria bacterium]